MQALALETGLLFQDRPGIIELQGHELGLGGKMEMQDISLLGNGVPMGVQRTGAVRDRGGNGLSRRCSSVPRVDWRTLGNGVWGSGGRAFLRWNGQDAEVFLSSFIGA